MFRSSTLRCAPCTKIAVLGAAKLPLRIEIWRGCGPSKPSRGLFLEQQFCLKALGFWFIKVLLNYGNVAGVCYNIFIIRILLGGGT